MARRRRPSLSDRPWFRATPSARRFLIGAAVTGLALLLRALLPPAVGNDLASPLYLLAVIAAAWLGGVWAALVAAIACLALVLPPGGSWLSLRWSQLPVVLALLVTGAVAGALTAQLRAAMRQMRSERARYQAILHSVGEMLLVVDADGRLEFFNRQAKDKLGLSLAALGRPLAEVLPLRRGMHAIDPLASAGQEQVTRLPEPLEVELGARGVLPVAGSVAPVGHRDGARGHVLSLEDISELMASHRRLARSESKLRALFDSELLAVVTTDLQGRLRSANAAFLALLGYPDDQFAEPPATLRELTPVDYWPADEYALAELTARGSCRPYGKAFRRCDDRLVQVIVGAAIVNRDEVAMFAIDAAARSEADARVSETRELLQAIIDSIPAFVGYVDADMRYLLGNRYRLGQLGEHATLVDRPLVEVFEHDQYLKLAPHVRRALAGVAAHTTLALTDDGGSFRQYSVQLQPRFSDDGARVDGVVMHAFDITDQLQRQKAMHDSEVRFRRLAEATAAIVCHVAGNGTILYLSGWRRFTGIDGIASHFAELYARVHRADRARLRRFLARCRRRGSKEEVEFRLCHASGEYRHVAVRAVPVPGRAGEAGEWVGSARDVHDKRSALERLRQAERELRLILDTMPARIAYIESDGRFRWANRSFLDWSGCDDVRGRRLADVYGAEDLIALGDALERGFRGFPSQVEWMQEHRRLGARWSLTTVTPEIAGDGTVTGCITLETDHTERRRTEQALRRSNREHRALAESVPHMVWIAYGDGRMFYFNQRWRDYTGLTAVDPWHRAVFADDRSAALTAFRSAIADGREFAFEARLLRAADGAARWHMLRAVPVADEGGKIARWYGTCTDIEDQKQAQQTLQMAQQRTQQFLATLSHELRNPLAALMTSAHLLNRSDLPERQRPLLAQTVRRQTVQLQRLVEDLLDISRITQGKVQLQLREVELGRIVRDVCDDFAERAAREQVTLRCRQIADDAFVRGDPARLRQIVDNLVSNALKATPAGGEVVLALARDGDRLLLSVSDSGSGIPPALIPRMFEPFVQGDSWRERGLGLGLSVVMRMAQLHDGDVRAENIEGGGARFEVRLPAVQPEQPSVVEPVAMPATAAADGLRLLIIDDEIDHARALQVLLELHGYQLQTAHDGEQALALVDACDAHGFDAVICDIGLPGEWNGYRLARELRRRLGDRVLLLAFSGYGTQADVQRAREAGFDGHLLKPSTPAEVLAALRDGLADKRADEPPPAPPALGAAVGGG